MPQDVVMNSNLNVSKKTRKISKNMSMTAFLYANSETTLCSKGLLSRQLQNFSQSLGHNKAFKYRDNKPIPGWDEQQERKTVLENSCKSVTTV